MVGFFIQRPVFASAIAAILVLAGGICFFLLPVSQFPEITPPQVVVSATLGAIYVSQMQIDVYSQIGFIMLIGLAAAPARRCSLCRRSRAQSLTWMV